MLPPVVLTELLSDAKLSPDIAGLFKSLPMLDLSEGYWERAGVNRASIFAKGHKARIADALITQSCLDHRLRLLTRDGDFKAYARVCRLQVVP